MPARPSSCQSPTAVLLTVNVPRCCSRTLAQRSALDTGHSRAKTVNAPSRFTPVLTTTRRWRILMKRTTRAVLAAAAAGSLLLGAAGCSGSDDNTDATKPGGKVELTFWSWVPGIDKVVDQWNSAHPDVHVTVSKQAQGDEEVTK